MKNLTIQDLVFISLALKEYENNTYQSDKLTATAKKVDSELKTRWASAHSNPY